MSQGFLENTFGSLDLAARTLAGVGTYVLLRSLENDLGWEPPWGIEQIVTLVIAVAAAGLLSTRVWRRPVLTCVWKIEKVPAESDTVEIRLVGLQAQRVITHEIVASQRSVLSSLVMGVLKRSDLRLEVRVASGFWALTKDSVDPVLNIDVFPGGGGFAHDVLNLGESGRLTSMRLEWRSRTGNVGSNPLNYALRSSSRVSMMAARLVRLDAPVKQVCSR